jgi:hypothetical protein
VKLTKQGVRDLGGVVPRRWRPVFVCPHVWDREVEWDCYDGTTRRVFLRCGLCQEVRR